VLVDIFIEFCLLFFEQKNYSDLDKIQIFQNLLRTKQVLLIVLRTDCAFVFEILHLLCLLN
jgi:hypothetical protein